MEIGHRHIAQDIPVEPALIRSPALKKTSTILWKNSTTTGADGRIIRLIRSRHLSLIHIYKQEASGEGGGTFIVPINTNTVASLTPYNVYGADDLLIASAPCFDPLFIVTKDETRWYLAESLEATADDGCHYQMKLKDGLTWHDGEAITADDVVYTVNVLLDAANTSCLLYTSPQAAGSDQSGERTANGAQQHVGSRGPQISAKE